MACGSQPPGMPGPTCCGHSMPPKLLRLCLSGGRDFGDSEHWLPLKQGHTHTRSSSPAPAPRRPPPPGRPLPTMLPLLHPQKCVCACPKPAPPPIQRQGCPGLGLLVAGHGQGSPPRDGLRHPGNVTESRHPRVSHRGLDAGAARPSWVPSVPLPAPSSQSSHLHSTVSDTVRPLPEDRQRARVSHSQKGGFNPSLSTCCAPPVHPQLCLAPDSPGTLAKTGDGGA